jgi:lipopolysaccharide assembly protein B
MLQLLLLLLPVAALSGWLAGYRQHKSNEEPEAHSLIPHDYFLGLNYLINEQPDKAVDVFIKMLEVNSDTVETHLALGNLFRRRGETDRAIRIHQNLIARPQLARQQRVLALSELAQDYLRAGVLDRAERLFLELIEMKDEMPTALNYLVNIYQLQKDWQQAINTAKRLEGLSKINMQPAIAHYYCELAEVARAQKHNEQALEYIKEAVAYDRTCARANIILGKIHEESGQFKLALRAYKNIQEQNPEYVSEIITQLANCYCKLDLEEEFVGYLEKCLKDNPRIYFILAMADYIRKHQGDGAAINYILEQSQRCLSLRGLARLVGLYINNVDSATRDTLLLLKEFIDKLSENKPVYRYIHCGFAGKQMYWQCPSCRRWNVVRPIHGLEGD